MNNNQYFDDRIREQFSNYMPDVHPRIWENIAAKKDRRRPAGFWLTFFNSRNVLLFASLVLVIGTGAFFLIRNYYDISPTPHNNTPVSIAIDKPVNDLPARQSGDKELSPVNNDANAVVVAGQDIQKNSLPSFSPVAHTTLSSQGLSYPSTVSRNRLIKSPGLIPDNPLEYVDEMDNLSLGGSLLGRLIYNAQKNATRSIPEYGLKNRKTPSWFLPDCPKLENDAAGNKKYIEIYGGPDFAIRKLSDTGNSVYLQKRKESTKFSSAYSAGLRYTRVFNSGMSLRAGVNYSQINEKFTYVQGNLVQITYIINANGDTTGSYITTGTRYKTTHNKYRSVDVPVLVGYEMGNGKIHANISAGAVVNLYSWQKGEVLDTSYQPVSITTGKGSTPYQFKTNVGVGFITSASVYYKLNEKIHVMAEPYFRYNFAPMNSDNLTLKQKYSTVGLRLGIRVDLK